MVGGSPYILSDVPCFSFRLIHCIEYNVIRNGRAGCAHSLPSCMFLFYILNNLHFYLLLLLTVVTGAKLGANTDD